MQASAIVLDVGVHMSNIPAPGYEPPIESAKESLKNFVMRQLFSQTKDEAALVLVGSDDTNNPLADNGNFENISIVQDLGRCDWNLMDIISKIDVSNTAADLIDGIIVAANHIVEQTKGRKGKVTKRIIMVSNLAVECNDERIDKIIKKLKKEEIELLLIGGDLPEDDDDDEDGPQGDRRNNGASNNVQSQNKMKSRAQIKTELIFASFLKQMDGACHSFDNAAQIYSRFQLKGVAQRAWKADLTFGETLMAIPVLGYTSVSEAKPLTFKDVYARQPDARVETDRTYNLNDEAETEVEADDTVKGYRYGSTLVPFNDDDISNMKHKEPKSLTLLGFTDQDNVGLHLRSGNSTIIFVADPAGGPSGVETFNSIVHALLELKCAAIVRRVYNAASQPRLAALVPKLGSIDEDDKIVHSLVYTEMPYNEDIRSFIFPSLSGENADRFTPNQDQLNVIDSLIDTMNLEQIPNTNGGEDDTCKPKNMLNPFVQHLYKCVAARIQDPKCDLPEEPSIIKTYLDPPPAFEVAAADILQKLPKVFPTKKIEKKKPAKVGEEIFGGEEAGDDVEPAAKRSKVDLADVTRAPITSVGSVNPLDDFKELLNRGREVEAFRGLGQVASDLVENSFGAQFYPKALNCVRALRKAAVEHGNADIFNKFLQDWKVVLKATKAEFWKLLCDEQITLINNACVTSQDAAAFISEESTSDRNKYAAAEEENDDDLFDDME